MSGGKKNERVQGLQQIAEQAWAAVGGDGLAVVLSQDEGMVCAISLGLAPPVGTPVAAGSRLSRECVEQARLVYSADTHHDPRVARSPIPAVRSVLLVPILVSGKTTGLIAAFARRPDAFNPRHFYLLHGMASAMATVVAPAPAVEEPASPPDEPDAGESRLPGPASAGNNTLPQAPDPTAPDPSALHGIEDNLADWARWERRHWRNRILIAVLVGVLFASGVTAMVFSYQIGVWVRMIRIHLHRSHPAAPLNPPR